jgi:uncharacterized protein (TIGR02145 family)
MRADDCETFIGTPFYIQGACPDGWYIPFMNEWAELMNHLGGSEKAGAEMKTNTWSEPMYTSSNLNRFSIEPSGWYYYEPEKDFRGLFSSAYFWSGSQNPFSEGFSSYAIALVAGNPECHTITMLKSAGYSFRCVKDH